MKLSKFFSNYHSVRAELIEAVGDLTPEQLRWTPDHHSNSIGLLLLHIAGAEYYWISQVVLKEDPLPDTDLFREETSLSETLRIMEKYGGLFSSYMNSEEIEDWDDIFYKVVRSDEKVSKRWLVWHVVEHQDRHRGQIFMMMRMQGLEVPNV